ncbi:MAG: hypothetical protein ACI3ZL_07220 [Candidatus Cryptobacteroides sp.]
MKGFIVIAACLALTFVLEGIEKIRRIQKSTKKIPVKKADDIQEALNRYKDLMD